MSYNLVQSIWNCIKSRSYENWVNYAGTVDAFRYIHFRLQVVVIFEILKLIHKNSPLSPQIYIVATNLIIDIIIIVIIKIQRIQLK